MYTVIYTVIYTVMYTVIYTVMYNIYNVCSTLIYADITLIYVCIYPYYAYGINFDRL